MRHSQVRPFLPLPSTCTYPDYTALAYSYDLGLRATRALNTNRVLAVIQTAQLSAVVATRTPSADANRAYASAHSMLLGTLYSVISQTPSLISFASPVLGLIRVGRSSAVVYDRLTSCSAIIVLYAQHTRPIALMRQRIPLQLLALISQRRQDLVGKPRSHFTRRNTHGAQ